MSTISISQEDHKAKADGHPDPTCVDENTLLCYTEPKEGYESSEIIGIKNGRRTIMCTFKNPRDGGYLCSYEMVETEPTSTPEEVKNDYTKKCDEWKNSECWKDLEIMLRCLLSEGHICVDHCVLLGPGSPSSAKYGSISTEESRQRSLLQFSVFCSAASLIASCQNDKPPKLFAQEPRFNDVDRELCHYLGIQTVGHPEGFQKITGNSFAYCPGAEQMVDLRCFERDPALYLGGEAETWLDARGRLRSRFEAIAYDENQRMVPADESYGAEDALCAQIVKTFMSTREEHVLHDYEDGAVGSWLVYKKNQGAKSA